MDKINKQKPIYIKNLLSKDELNMFSNYAHLFHENNTGNIDLYNDIQTEFFETKSYGDTLSDSLLVSKREVIVKTIIAKLLPSYAYWRMYIQYSKLPKHQDRPSCEITISINIGSDKPWPIFVNNDEFYIGEGDGLLYFGHELEHYRNEYEGDYSCNLFFHYVLKDGEHANEQLDGRAGLGKFKKE